MWLSINQRFVGELAVPINTNLTDLLPFCVTSRDRLPKRAMVHNQLKGRTV